jgi:hypothetical protein
MLPFVIFQSDQKKLQKTQNFNFKLLQKRVSQKRVAASQLGFLLFVVLIFQLGHDLPIHFTMVELVFFSTA